MTKELCFVHVPKTAGVSWISGLLAGIGPVDTIVKELSRFTVRPLRRPGLLITVLGHERRVPGFMTLDQYLQHTRHDCYAIAFVRNPFDRLVSSFHYLVGGGINRLDQVDRERFVRRYGGSFNAFVHGALSGDPPDAFAQIHLRPQREWLVDDDGRLLAHFVGRYERIVEDTMAVTSMFDLGAAPIPHLNATEHRPYWEHYAAASWNIVARAYRRDFETFAYDPAERSKS